MATSLVESYFRSCLRTLALQPPDVENNLKPLRHCALGPLLDPTLKGQC